MAPTEWIAAGQLAVSTVGVARVWRGLYQVRHAGDQREKRDDARHRETMQALADQTEMLAGQTEALRVAVASLETLVASTGVDPTDALLHAGKQP